LSHDRPQDAATVLFNLPGYRVLDAVDDPGGGRRVLVEPVDRVGHCPDCGFDSARVHSRPVSRVADVPIAGRLGVDEHRFGRMRFTPKHSSWLNIAEIELSRLTRRCLVRRIDDLDLLNSELAAWQAATNADQRQVDWQFTTSDARTKLRHLYPQH